MNLRSALATLAAVLAVACSSGSDAPPQGAPPPGSLVVVDCGAGTAVLEGTFTAPNGTTPVGGATVAVSTASCTASTSAEGKFKFVNLPATTTQVSATKGNFSASVTTTPGAGVVTLAIPADAVHLAYVPGAFDSIEDILAGLGFAPTQLSAEALATASLSSYDALFLNCGMSDYSYDAATLAALRAYVDGGGTLYASDWAYSYVVAAFPGKVNMLQPDPLVGDATETPVTATVLDASLQAALGKGSAAIMFDLGGWAVIDSAPAGTDVLITGPVAYYDWDADVTLTATKPYAVRFASGSGRVTYTSFHNEAQVTADMQKLLESMVFGL